MRKAASFCQERKSYLNRTAQCLRMLAILKNAASPVPTATLAQELKTNPRNIREYRRELEEAGYHISETRGRYGGYSLEKRHTLAVPAMSEEEKQALEEAASLVSSSGLVHQEAFSSFLDKIHLASSGQSTPGISYLFSGQSPVDETVRRWISLALEGIAEHRTLKLKYQSRSSREPEGLDVDPYEVISFDGAPYLIGWCRQRHAWRTYRFSALRMESLELTDRTFERSLSFSLDDIIGVSSVFRGAMIRYTIRVTRSAERLFLEQNWGSGLNKERETRQYAEYSFLQDSFGQLCTMMFAFGEDIVLMAPHDKKEAYEARLRTVLQAQTQSDQPDEEGGNGA